MSRNVMADALEFAKPGGGLFTMPSLGVTMSFPNADRFRREQPAKQEPDAPIESTDAQRSTEQPSTIAQTMEPAAQAISPMELDRRAVQAALNGDQFAFSELVSRYQSAVFNMAYRMLGDPTEAEDATQEVFVRAWNQLHTFQLDRRFSTWLLSIASHYCIDMLRRRRPTAPLDDVALYIESGEPSPDELTLQDEQSEIVKGLLNKLPEKYRSVTVLRYYNDLSYEEIARMTGLSESAVKTQLHRARRMLAEQILTKGGTPHGLPDNLR